MLNPATTVQVRALGSFRPGAAAAWINPPKKEIALHKKPSNCTLN